MDLSTPIASHISNGPCATFKEPAERQGTERVRETEYGETVRFPEYRFQKHLTDFRRIGQIAGKK